MNNVTRMHKNILLDAISEEELARFTPHLELVKVQRSEKILRPNHPSKYVYFPTTSVFSMQIYRADGSSADMATVGNEGIVGISLFICDEAVLNSAIVKNNGFAYRMRGERLIEEFLHSISIQRLLLDYMRTLLTQMETSPNNRYHSS